MKMKRIFAFALVAIAAPAAGQQQPTPAQAAAGPWDPAARLAAQREAMTRFAYMDGVWRGPAWVVTREGRHELTQTERIGPFLGSTVRVIEGRGYDSNGEVSFNALGVISYDPATRRYSMNSWAMGYTGTFPLQATEDGYIWEVPAGPAGTTRYTATIQRGTWREIGERISGNGPPVQIFEMNLRRVGDSRWPADGAVASR
jgi:hypothetical protein